MQYRVTLRHPQFATKTIPLDLGDVRSTRQVFLGPGGVLAGEVRGADGKARSGGRWYEVSSEGRMREWQSPAEGRVQWLSLDHDQRKDVVLVEAELRPQVLLTGRLYWGDHLAPGVRVSIQSIFQDEGAIEVQLRSGPSGAIEARLPVGEYFISLCDEWGPESGGSGTQRIGSFELTRDAEAFRWELPGGGVFGRVVSQESGSPIAAAEIGLQRHDPGSWLRSCRRHANSVWSCRLEGGSGPFEGGHSRRRTRRRGRIRPSSVLRVGVARGMVGVSHRGTG